MIGRYFQFMCYKSPVFPYYIYLPQLQGWQIFCLQKLLLRDHYSRGVGVAGWKNMVAELIDGWSLELAGGIVS